MHSETPRPFERSPLNKLEEAIEKLELVQLLQQSGFSFADNLPDDVVARAQHIASLEEIESLDTVKELTVIEFIISQLSKEGLSEDELAEEVESSLFDTAELLLAAPGHEVTAEEVRMVLRSALKASLAGTPFTDALLQTVHARRAVRSDI